MAGEQQKNQKIPEGPINSTEALSLKWAREIKKTTPHPSLPNLKRKGTLQRTAFFLPTN